MTAQPQPINVRRIVLDSLTTQSIVFAALASVSVFLLTRALDWPSWAATIATVSPFLPLVVRQTRWTAGISIPLALFYGLIVTQGAHFGEHIAQMIQIHVLGLHGMQAMGLIALLNMEWVHFIWNMLVLLALIPLVWWYRANRYVWLSLVFATWHVIEHVVIMRAYLSTGMMGDPGILARGGMFGDGVGLTRPDLHFLYKLLVTIPVVIAFVQEARRTRRADSETSVADAMDEVMFTVIPTTRTRQGGSSP